MISTVDGKVVAVKLVADATKLETDKITANVLVDLGLVKGYTDTNESAIATLDGKVVTLDAVADAIKLETDKIEDIKTETDKITTDVLVDLGLVKGYTDSAESMIS